MTDNQRAFFQSLETKLRPEEFEQLLGTIAELRRSSMVRGYDRGNADGLAARQLDTDLAEIPDIPT